MIRDSKSKHLRTTALAHAPAPEAAAAAPPPRQPIQEPGRDAEPGCLRSLFSCCLPRLPHPAAAAAARVAPAPLPTGTAGTRILSHRVVAPGVASDAAPGVASDAAPGVAPDAAPDAALGVAPGVASDAPPGVASDAAPEIAPPAVTRLVTSLVHAHRFQDAGQVFADAALGPSSTPEQCCALMQWLNDNWAQDGEVGVMFRQEPPTQALMEKAFGEAGAKVLSDGGQSGTAHLEAVARFAAAYECPGFPRLASLEGEGCGYRLGSDLRELRRAQDVLRCWIGSLLAQLPTQQYSWYLTLDPATLLLPQGHSLSQMSDPLAHRPAQREIYLRDQHIVRRPVNWPLVLMLQHKGGPSLPAAMLCLWAASFGRYDRDQRGPIEPDYLSQGVAKNREAQAVFLGRMAQILSVKGMPRQPLERVVFCLASGLSDSQFGNGDYWQLQEQMRTILLHAFPDSPPLSFDVSNVLTQQVGLAGLPPDVAPYAILAGPGTVEDKQDRVTAWFTEVIGRLTPEVFADQRQRLATMLAERESAAHAAWTPSPARSAPESKASAAAHSAHSARSASAAASLDDEVADEALIDRRTALRMFYGSYNDALKTLLRMAEPLDGRGGQQDPRGAEPHLLSALATPILRRHAGIVAQEQAWLSTWSRQDRHAAALGADLLGFTLRQLEAQLRKALGQAAAVAPAPAPDRVTRASAGPGLPAGK